MTRRLNKRKRGGTLRKNNIIKILKSNTPNLDAYYPYLEIMRSIVKQGCYFEIKSSETGKSEKTEICIKGDAVDSVVEYGDRGKDTLAMIFECNKNFTVLFKAYLNMEFTTNKETYDEYKMRMTDIHSFGPLKEFSKIREFDSPYLIKAFKYFFFDGTSCEMSSMLPPNISSDIYIIDVVGDKPLQVSNNFAKSAGWSIPRANKVGPQTNEIPWFSGIVLEYGKYNIYNNFKEHYTNINILFNLYKQYLMGLMELSSKGWIHTNIHRDNLWYNYDKLSGNFTAKIIHMHKAYNLVDPKKIVKFKEGRKLITPNADKQFLLSATADMTTMPNPVKGALFIKTNEAQISLIKDKYDIYGLSKSFTDVLNIIESNIQTRDMARINLFKKILTDSAHEDFNERISNKEALARISQIIT